MVLGVSLWAKDTKESVYNSIIAKYASLENISLQFSLRNNPDITGSIVAERGNKYAMQLQGRKIISNGETIWNYHTLNNNVIISTFNPNSNEMSIEKFFFSLLKEYEPESLASENDGGIKVYVLTLISSKESDLGKIKLWIDQQSKTLKGIGFMLEDYYQIWDIGNLKINQSIEAKTFIYKPGRNVEIIDLRDQ